MAINFLNTATGITEAVGDNSTKIATTAYADAAASAIPIGNYLPLAGGTLTGGLIGTTVKYNTQLSTSFSLGQKAFIGISSSAGAAKFKIYKNTSTADGYARFKIDRAYDYGNNDQMVQEAIFQRRTTTNNFVFKYDGDIATSDDIYLEVYELSNGQIEIWLCVDDYAQPVVEVISNPNTSEIYTAPSAGTPAGTLIHSSNPDTETPNWNSHQGEITATTFLGDLNGTINTATTGVTQTDGDNSTLIATTAYADAAAAIGGGNFLPLSAGASKPLTGSLYIPNYIYHVGDAGTFIGFPANDRLIIGTNGGTRVDITNSGFCLGDSGSNISVSTILDEDDMASDSATALVTQQSIKAYVDAQTPGAGVFLPLAGGTMTGTGSIDTPDQFKLRFGAGNDFQIYHQGGTSGSYIDNYSGNMRFNNYGNDTDIVFNNDDGSGGTTTYLTLDGSTTHAYFSNPGNVGIGTTSPSEKLEVEGSLRVNRAGSSAQYGIFGQDSNGGFINYQRPASGTLYENFRFIASNQVGTVERMRIDTSGNVGIGTTSPIGKLTVSDAGGTGLEITPQDANSKISLVAYDRLDFAYRELNFDAYNYTFRASNNVKAVMLNNGNVGIGTTSPFSKLEVVDTNRAPSLTFDANAAFSISTNASDQLAFGQDTAGPYSYWMQVRTSANAALPLSLNPLGGDVGIGTTTPQKTLHIEGASGASASQLLVTGASDTDEHTAGILLRAEAGEADSALRAKGGIFFERVAQATSYGLGKMHLAVNGTANNDSATVANSVLTILGSGNVGIGTTAPTQAKLVVSGNVAFNQGDETMGQINPEFERLDFKVDDGVTSATSVAMTLRYYADGARLGIGTTSPLEKLEVQGTVYATPISYAANQSAYALKMGASNNTAFDMGIKAKSTSSGGPYMSLCSANTEDVIVVQNSYVGIGTTSPYGKLDVAGNIRLQSDNQIYFGGTGSIPYWTAGVDNTTNNNFVIGGESYYSGDRDILLNPVNNGNVGIKTTSPSYELDVVGDIRARGNGTGNIYSGTYGARLSNYYSYLTTNAEFRVGYAGGTYATCRASAFTVTSDYRLKEKIVPLTDSLDRLGQLNVYKFNWIDKPNEEPVDGFIAHEVAEVIPEAVVGVKDEIGPDGKPEYQGLDQAKIVPLLTAALQESITKIEQLEQRIQTLENK